MLIRNPVIRGFNPDPSICRKGNDFYIVTSTFEYFPAVPIYHSTNLAEWEQIGFCITDPRDLDLSSSRSAKGIYAPTIRYKEEDDTFYMITTLVKNDCYHENECILMSAKDPAGPWKKQYIKEAEGIDPALFFHNGEAYCLGNMRPHPENPADRSRWIWISRIDLDKGKLIGERKILLKDGAVRGAACPEGPHLFFKDGFFYLLIAEGGTSHNHAVSVFRSTDVYGPYEPDPRNPVLTHRMMGRGSEFNSIGHADLIQLPDGSWWSSVLGVRPYEDPMLRNIGRETFIVPVIWEDDWPVFAPETGKVEAAYESPIDEPIKLSKAEGTEKSFPDKLPLAFETLRAPSYSIKDGKLSLQINQFMLTEPHPAAFAGVRQTEKIFEAEAEIEFSPEENEEAGLAVILNQERNYTLAITEENGKTMLRLSYAGEKIEEAECSSHLVLRFTASGLEYRAWHRNPDENGFKAFGPVLDGSKLSIMQGGFTGVLFGMYGSSNGKESRNSAEYSYFRYRAE